MSNPNVCSARPQDSLGEDECGLGRGGEILPQAQRTTMRQSRNGCRPQDPDPRHVLPDVDIDAQPTTNQVPSASQHERQGHLFQGDLLADDVSDIFRLASLNIRGGLRQKLNHLCEWMHQQSVDVLCIQEHNSSQRSLRGLHGSLQGKFGLFGTAPTGQFGGSAILLTKRWTNAIQGITRGADGRSLAIDFFTRLCRPIRVVCTYGPSSFRHLPAADLTVYTETLQNLLIPYRSEHPTGRLFVGGDFNMVERPSLDRNLPPNDPRGRASLTSYEQTMIDLLAEAQLTDIFRRCHPRLRSFTHRQATQSGLSEARLDRIYADDSPGIVGVTHLTSSDEQTDHIPVIADFSLSIHMQDAPRRSVKPTPRDPRPNLTDVKPTDPRWEQFTEATACTDGLGDDLESIPKRLFDQALSLFPPGRPSKAERSVEDVALSELHYEVTLLRRVFRIHSHDWALPSTRKAMRRICRLLMERGIAFPTLREDGLTADSLQLLRIQLVDRRKELRSQTIARDRRRMQDLRDNCLSNFQSRQMRKWYRQTALEKTGVITSHAVMIESNGQRILTTDAVEVRNGVRDRYHKISARSTAPLTEAAMDWGKATYVPAPELPDLMTVLEPITPEELDQAIDRLPSGKAPGPDGVVAELYKHAHESVRQALLTEFNRLLSGSPLPKTWAHGIIYPVPKATGLPTIENSRPISLLSTQRKLFERLLCNRIESVLERTGILHKDQHGFVPGRSTLTPVMTLNAILETARDTNTPLYGVLFDVSKAFDTVPPEGLEMSMSRLGFPKPLRQLLMALNTGGTAQVITAHGLTEAYDVERGVRQGSILSPLLWRIFMDPILCQWSEQPDPFVLTDGQGGEVSIFGQAYADDAMGVSSSLSGLAKRVTTMDCFCNFHRMSLNISKSELFSNRVIPEDHPLARMTVLAPGIPFRYLGVIFTVLLDWRFQEAALAGRLKGMSDELRARRLTYLEAALLYKTVIVPVVSYVATVAGISDAFLRRWDSIFGRILLNKLTISQGTTRGVLYGGEYSLGLRLPSLLDMRRVRHVSELLVSLNSSGLLGEIVTTMMARLQFEHGLHDLPLRFPIPRGIRSNSWLTRCWIYLKSFNMSIAAPEWKYSFRPQETDTSSPLLRHILPSDTPRKIWQDLAFAKKFFLGDILDRDRRFVAYVGTGRRSPAWYHLVLRTCCIPHRGRRVRDDLLTPLPPYDPPDMRQDPITPPQQLQEEREWVLATDGALLDGDERIGRAAIGCCLFENDVPRQHGSRRIPHHFLSSTDVELTAVVSALEEVPSNHPVTVVSDSLSVVNKLQRPRLPLTDRAVTKLTGRPIWRRMHRLLSVRTAPTTFVHVRAHTIDRPTDFTSPEAKNWIADKLAREAMESQMDCPSDQIPADELSFVLVVNDNYWPHSPEKALWKMVRTLHDESWAAKRRQGFNLRRLLSHEVDSKSFLAFHQTRTHGRSPMFLTKVWMNVLPTASVLALRDTSLSPLCTFCENDERETNTHLMVGCTTWNNLRSDLLWRLGEFLAALLNDNLEQPVPLLLESAGLFGFPDLWFGLFPKRTASYLAENSDARTAPRLLRKLSEYWIHELLPLLWRERCRRSRHPDQPALQTDEPRVIDIRIDETMIAAIETECLPNLEAASTLEIFTVTCPADLSRDLGPRRQKHFEPVRDKMRLPLQGSFRSLYLEHDRWAALAHASLAELGPIEWTLSTFRDLLVNAWKRYNLEAQLQRRSVQDWSLTTPFRTLLKRTLGTRMELYGSPFDCHPGYTVWFSNVEEYWPLGFKNATVLEHALPHVQGSCSLGFPPHRRRDIRLAIELAATAIRTDKPTRIVLAFPPGHGSTRSHRRLAQQRGGHLFLRLPARCLQLLGPNLLTLTTNEPDRMRTCPRPLDIFVYENTAASTTWRPARSLNRIWESWLADNLLLAPDRRTPTIRRLRRWNLGPVL